MEWRIIPSNFSISLCIIADAQFVPFARDLASHSARNLVLSDFGVDANSHCKELMY